MSDGVAHSAVGEEGEEGVEISENTCERGRILMIDFFGEVLLLKALSDTVPVTIEIPPKTIEKFFTYRFGLGRWRIREGEEASGWRGEDAWREGSRRSDRDGSCSHSL